MLYHDPELCGFLDTKKIQPDSYAHQWVANKTIKITHFWVLKLFVLVSSFGVCLPRWPSRPSRSTCGTFTFNSAISSSSFSCPSFWYTTCARRSWSTRPTRTNKNSPVMSLYFRTEIQVYMNLNEFFFFIEMIANSPANIDVEDLTDFNSLCQSFGTRTPQSFRKVNKAYLDKSILRNFHSTLFHYSLVSVSIFA